MLRRHPTIVICFLFLGVAPAMQTGCILDWERKNLPQGSDTIVDAGVDSGGDTATADATMDVACITPAHDASCDDGDGGWCRIPAGCFVMGSPDAEPCRDDESNDEDQHRVILTRDFELQKYETSVSEFLIYYLGKLGGPNPKVGGSCNKTKGRPCPMTELSWLQAVAVCDALNLDQHLNSETSCYEKTPFEPAIACDDTDNPCEGDNQLCVCWSMSPAGCAMQCVEYKLKQAFENDISLCSGYRLPTEAEWEYAYRAGTNSAFYSGSNPGPSQCSDCPPGQATDIAQYLCYEIEAGNRDYPQPSGGRTANRWGLYDLAGNANEWTFDAFTQNLGSSPATNPQGPKSGTQRVTRGGHLGDHAKRIRAASRSSFPAAQTARRLGLRCARSLLSP